MADIEALAKRIILIGNGSILYDGTLHNLKKKYDYLRKVEIVTNDKIKINKEYIVSQKEIEDGLEFIIDIRKIDLSDFIKLISSKINIIDIEVDSENIDELIVKLYEEFKI